MSEHTTIDTIVFDLGGVLIDWNPRYLYRKIFDTEDEMEHFLAHICTSDWNEQQDGGRPFAEATALLVKQHPDYDMHIRAFADRWSEMLAGPIAGTVDIFRELKNKQQSRLVALTNWSAETFPVALERYDFLQWFEGILVSGKENLKKPDPKIYQLLADRYSIRPERAVFIDDSERNLRGAESIGLHTIHFQSPEQLRQDLQKLKLI